MFDYFRKLELKRLFGKYVSNEEIVEILNSENNDDYLKLKEQEIYFILLKIKNVVENNKTPTLSKIIEQSSEHGAILEQIMGPIVLLSYGTLKSTISEPVIIKLINELLSKNKNEVAIVHGRQKAYVGNAGNNHRCTYGTMLNNISAILTELGNLNYGESKEIKQA